MKLIRSSAWSMIFVLALAGAIAQSPQEVGNAPETKAPAPATQKPGPTATPNAPASPTQGSPAPQAPTPEQIQAQRSTNSYWIEHDKKMLTDFGDLAHFQAANAALPAPAPGENRVVFMGDSITEGWHFDTSFPGKPYINRGISGQTTPQMLVRFRQDVVALHPAAVIILAGTNDLARNTGPMTLEQTENNISSMADIATANHIRVVLCSITPSLDFWWYSGLQPAQKIIALNKWINDYAAQRGFVFVDYHSALADARGGLPSNLSRDGVHPNPAGYAIMTPLAEAGIRKALAQ